MVAAFHVEQKTGNMLNNFIMHNRYTGFFLDCFK